MGLSVGSAVRWRHFVVGDGTARRGDPAPPPEPESARRTGPPNEARTSPRPGTSRRGDAFPVGPRAGSSAGRPPRRPRSYGWSSAVVLERSPARCAPSAGNEPSSTASIVSVGSDAVTAMSRAANTRVGLARPRADHHVADATAMPGDGRRAVVDHRCRGYAGDEMSRTLRRRRAEASGARELRGGSTRCRAARPRGVVRPSREHAGEPEEVRRDAGRALHPADAGREERVGVAVLGEAPAAAVRRRRPPGRRARPPSTCAKARSSSTPSRCQASRNTSPTPAVPQQRPSLSQKPGRQALGDAGGADAVQAAALPLRRASHPPPRRRRRARGR